MQGDVFYMPAACYEQACGALGPMISVDLEVHVRHAMTLTVGSTCRFNGTAIGEPPHSARAPSRPKSPQATVFITPPGAPPNWKLNGLALKRHISPLLVDELDEFKFTLTPVIY